MEGKKPKEKKFTWCQKSPFIFCRLDYWLISDSLQDLIKNVDIIAAIKTDHSAIVLHLQGFEETKKGPGFWKMNTSLLSDENFIQLMKTNLEIWKEGKDFSDKRVAWDWIKYKVRLFSMQYSKELRERKRKVCRRNSKLLKYNFNKILVKNLKRFWISVGLS